MSYKNATQVLPPELLKQIQEYIDGDFLYIPRLPNQKRAWGEMTVTKQELSERNESICAAYLAGVTPEVLASQYFLSEKSIYRIIGNLKKQRG